VKAIERMELVAQAQFDSPFAFEFYPCSRAGSPLLNCQAVDAGYPNGPAILKKIQFAINPGDRLALLGPNGQGKSTFIKTLTGHLPPLAGEVHRHVNLKIGYYAQHQLEELDNRLSPLQTLQTLSPEAREQDLRNYLGGFDFRGDMAVNPIHYFSGGEKARLALAKLIWLKPNLLLLDEPTNHLDLEMRAAIEIALQSYEGALILISHDRHLLKSTVDEFYLVYDQQVKAFNGDLDDYHQWLLQKDKAVESKPMSEAASQRDKKPLQNRLKKVEQLMLEQQTKLQALEQELALDQIYESAAQAQLNALLAKQQSAQTSLEALETEWLELITSLES
jgi:ATP-binding cassette subfamily F protein 3